MNPKSPTPPAQPARQRVAARLRAAVAAGALLAVMAPAQAQIDLSNPPVGWVAPMEFSTFRLSSGSAVAFRSDYIRSTWDGDFVASTVGSTGSTSVLWRARQMVPAWNQRLIFTRNLAGQGVRFEAITSGTGNGVHGAQLAQLGATTAEAAARLNWIRGDASQERTSSNPQGSMRPRFSRLGAFVHSRPYHDAGTVYVGSNGGMLHAFNAATGAERWAYVPSMLMGDGRFQALSAPFAQTFPYMVDGDMAIGRVGAQKLLVASLGLGGRGLFALDITNPTPANVDTAALMSRWEITPASSGFSNLGHVMSAPRLVRLNDGRDVVLVPNGLNGSAGTASLFVIDPSNGTRLAEIPAGNATSNGLGAIAAVDRDGNGTVDVVYGGDLAGIMWKFDFSGQSLPAAATALFTPATGTARPITAAPSVMAHPRGGMMVVFGTGRLLTQADLASTDTEYLYGIWDSPQASGTPVTQTLTTHTLTGGVVQARSASANAVDYTAGARGWRIALSGGERLVGNDTIIDSGRFIVTTTTPGGTTPNAWLMQVAALTGGALGKPFFDLNGDGQIRDDTSDRVPVTGGTLVPVGKRMGTGVWSQPVLAQVSNTLDIPFLNFNPNTALAAYTTTVTQPPPPPTSGGVQAGHFDFDIFYKCNSKSRISKDSCTNLHVHEYDDKFGVVGVNLVNASNSGFNLRNAISRADTRFKILVSNPLWSPAAALVIGPDIAAPAWQLPLSPEGFVAATPGGEALVFTRQELEAAPRRFMFVLPLDAFSDRDWGTGVVRTGLMPTQTSCMQANANPTGAFMDGAFTVQIVDHNTSASEVLAIPAANGGGFRLQDTNGARNRLLAQYSTFEHHPNDRCRFTSGFTFTPPANNSPPGDTETRASGSDDPRGSFYNTVINTGGGSGGGGGGGTGSGGIVTHFFNNVQVTVERIFSENGVQQILRNTSGTVVSNTSSSVGSTQRSDLQQAERARLGRLGWREVLR